MSTSRIPFSRSRPARQPVAPRGYGSRVVPATVRRHLSVCSAALVAGISTGLAASDTSPGLTRIVPDTPVIVQDRPPLGEWEPYASVLGTSTFLIEGNAYAEGTTDKQRYVVAFQPVDGGPMKLGEAFFADDGTPYLAEINLSRQDGNPGRVAGDVRPGAVNFMTGGEGSPHAYEAFRFGNRWDRGYDYTDPTGAGIRFASVQTFELDPEDLTQTAHSLVQDSANGRLKSGAAAQSENTSFGGDIVGLSNGDFLSVVEDHSRVRNPDGPAVVATIFGAGGSIVTDTFLVTNGVIRANVAPFNGGFAVRVAGRLFFFDNAGGLQGDPVDQASSGEAFDTGPGDGTRIAGHIHSPYVFLAGKLASGNLIRLAAWDSRTRVFVGAADVSDEGFPGDPDRVTAAVDALNRIVVAWETQPAGYSERQVATRVLAFDEATRTFHPQTEPFLPFLNATASGGIHSSRMSVAMTTQQILVAAMGAINLENHPELGANSPDGINFYTVLAHPDPQDDPTPPVGIEANLKLSVHWEGSQLVLSSDPQPLPEGYVLEQASLVDGPWNILPGKTTPLGLTVTNVEAVFLRATAP